jgi:hypothetical protein
MCYEMWGFKERGEFKIYKGLGSFMFIPNFFNNIIILLIFVIVFRFLVIFVSCENTTNNTNEHSNIYVNNTQWMVVKQNNFINIFRKISKKTWKFKYFINK